MVIFKNWLMQLWELASPKSVGKISKLESFRQELMVQF